MPLLLRNDISLLSLVYYNCLKYSYLPPPIKIEEITRILLALRKQRIRLPALLRLISIFGNIVDSVIAIFVMIGYGPNPT